MPSHDTTIRALSILQLDDLLVYLQTHIGESGTPGTAPFQPQSKDAPWRAADHRSKMAEAWQTEVGRPGWTRAWAAYDARDGSIVGHADLTARRDPYTAHRASLGIGVARSLRRQGLGHALTQTLIAWAKAETAIEWIDLRVLGGNTPAIALYQSMEFTEVGRYADMFRIDGASIADVLMTKRIRT